MCVSNAIRAICFLLVDWTILHGPSNQRSRRKPGPPDKITLCSCLIHKGCKASEVVLLELWTAQRRLLVRYKSLVLARVLLGRTGFLQDGSRVSKIFGLAAGV